ncbi:MAG: ABC transporter permease [Candidatus Bipolaricaulaceae bacterium]
MWGYSLRRALIALPTLLAVYTLVFLFVRVAPGDPAVAALGDYASREAVEALRESMGLNDPLWVQYLRSLFGYFRGDLGQSLINRVPVGRQVAKALPYTLQLTFAGILLGAILGVPAGILTALRRNRLADYVGRTLSLLGLSVPAFYLGILLMIALAIKVHAFPVMGGGQWGDPVDNLRHLALPAISLGIIMTAYVTRMTRSSILNVLGEDFVRTARAKGQRERAVVYGHVLRNAMIPIVSVLGVYSVVLIGDSVMTEVVFSRPGLGKLMVGAMLQRDYVALQSLILIYAVFVVFINLMTDLSYALIDPRVRYD